jgi:MraZ protein
MFRGRFVHAIDAKGRVSVPSSFRELLSDDCEETLVITNFDRCLVAFTLQEWGAIEARTRELSMLQKDVRAFIRIFYSGAVDCKIDKQGRVLIPPTLRDFAKLEHEAVLVGAVNRIEIWGKEVWEDYLKQSADNFEEITAKLSEFGI